MFEENPPYTVVDVTNWEVERLETIGGDEKYWLGDPETKDQWLFKPNVIHEHPLTGENWTQREDLSEKVAGGLGASDRPCRAERDACRLRPRH
jgi:hypothetical protein